MQILAEFQACLVPIIRRHGGIVDKFLGDGIMATFGAAAPTATYAADGLRAMDELMQEARRWSIGVEEGGGVPLRVNGGVAAGPIIFGAVGDRTRLEYTVIGDAANLSAKLMKHNKALHSEALTTAETYALALAQGYRPPQPRKTVAASEVAGVAEPLDVVIVD